MKDLQKQWENKQENEVFNPQNLEEAFEWMDKHMPGLFTSVRETSTAGLHHGAGTWLRNNLHLWEDCGKPYKERTPLSRWFNDNGIFHPDDMSGILFDSLERHLKGEDLKLEEQFKFYIDYWSRVDPNVNKGGM